MNGPQPPSGVLAMAGLLGGAIADLGAYVEARAQEIAEPRILEIEQECDRELALTLEDANQWVRRWKGVVDELRRRVERLEKNRDRYLEQVRRVEKYAGWVGGAEADKLRAVLAGRWPEQPAEPADLDIREVARLIPCRRKSCGAPAGTQCMTPSGFTAKTHRERRADIALLSPEKTADLHRELVEKRARYLAELDQPLAG